MRLSFSARALGWSATSRQSIELAARAGFDAVDLLLRDALDLEGESPDELAALLADSGLVGGAWTLPIRWKADDATYQADLAELPRYARAARLIGLTATGTWVLPAVTSEPGETPTATYSRWLDWHVDRLSPIARILADENQGFGLEIIGPQTFRANQGTPFIHQYVDLQPLIQKIRERELPIGLLLDSFHLVAAGESVDALSPLDGVPCVWSHLADLPLGHDGQLDHIHDEQRGLPGDHDPEPCRALLRYLQAQQFQGPVTVEPLAEWPGAAQGPDLSLARTVAQSARSLWPDPC